MEDLAILVLAAGKGTRMSSDLAKVLVSTDEKPLLAHVLETAKQLNPKKLIVVSGYQREAVEKVAKQYGAECAYQAQQLGTGHAALSAEDNLKDFSGSILILLGDVPLISSKTLQSLLAVHHNHRSTVTILSFKSDRDLPYGRIIRDQNSNILKIVETKDCTQTELLVNELNSGIYLVDSSFLIPALKQLKNNNAQNEYYLTDIVAQAAKEGQSVSAYLCRDSSELEGVNNRLDLSLINQRLKQNRIDNLILTGVDFVDRNTVFISASSGIAKSVKIGPNVQIIGRSVIEEGVYIEGSALIIDSHISKNSVIKLGSRIEGAVIGNDCQVGPFANIRPGSKFAAHVKIGNFVETKKAELAEGAKANHLTYLGDCSIGKNSNIGAGTITCNYDGKNKFRTEIGAEVFIGSNSSLVAPIKISDSAFVAAGSTITKNVESKALAIARAKQINKENWKKRS